MKMKQLLLKVLNVQSESYDTTEMEKFIINDVESLGLEVVYDNGNMYVTKGTAPYPCIVSHTDTVHKIIPQEDYTIIANDEFAIGFNKAKMEPTGCGGDDKVGIYICLQLLRDMDNIKVAFFRDEEVGCNGSYDANVKFFNDVRFVLQCDRRGNSDFVNEIYGVQLQSNRFKKQSAKIIRKYGYKPASGMLTDVYALAQIGVNVSVANMSCGYYNPHSDDETISFADVSNCLSMCYDLMIKMTDVYAIKREKVYAKPYSYSKPYKSYGGAWSDYDGWDNYYSPVDKIKTSLDDDYCLCDSCTEVKAINDVTFNIDYNCYLCADCAKELEIH
jgi:hypothetical protein